MIIVATAVLHDSGLLPYFVAHYRAVGADRFAIAVDRDGTGAAEALAYGDAQPDIDVLEVTPRYRRNRLVGSNEEDIRRAVAGPRDWVVPADLDELNQYPGDLPDLVGRMERAGAVQLVGHLVDRLAADGRMAPLAPVGRGRSLWDQYPLEAPLTTRFTQGETAKVLVARGDQALGLGHHRVVGEPAPAWPESGRAHHFKWREGLTAMLRWRIDHERRARMPWVVESERLLEILERSGGFDPDAVGAVPGWRGPDEVAERPSGAGATPLILGP